MDPQAEREHLSTKSHPGYRFQNHNNLLKTSLLQIRPCTSLFLNRTDTPFIIYFPTLALDLGQAV